MLFLRCLAIGALVASGSLQAALFSGNKPDQPRNICFSFREKGWKVYHTETTPKPYKVRWKSQLLLIPDDTYQAGVAATIPNPFQPPFEVRFEYSTWDDDGSYWEPWNSADGLTFFFLKDAANYGTPPDGDTLGLSRNGGGYGVGFHLYGKRYAQLTGPGGTVLARTPFFWAYSDQQWIPVKITVLTDRITVEANGEVILDRAVNLDQRFRDMGFTAATGGADGEHTVRELCLSTIPQKPATETQPEPTDE